MYFDNPIISAVIKSAIKYEKLTGRKLGITGEIGEFLVCKKLKLKFLKNPQVAGHDAVDTRGKKYQIKSRRVSHQKGRIGRFSKHKFDFAILVVLDENYKILEIWKTSYKKLKPILDRNIKPGFSQFKSISDRIYPKN